MDKVSALGALKHYSDQPSDKFNDREIERNKNTIRKRESGLKKLGEQIEVGHNVHIGFGAKGGVGFKGKVVKIEGDMVHVKHQNGKVYKGPKNFVSTERDLDHQRNMEIKNKIIEGLGNSQNQPKKREEGTDSLVKAFKKDTPGEIQEVRQPHPLLKAANKNLVDIAGGSIQRKKQEAEDKKRRVEDKKKEIAHHTEKMKEHGRLHDFHKQMYNDKESLAHDLINGHGWKDYGIRDRDHAHGAASELQYEAEKDWKKVEHHRKHHDYHRDMVSILTNKEHKGHIHEEVVNEGKMKELSYDLDTMDNGNFKKKYGKSKLDARGYKGPRFKLKPYTDRHQGFQEDVKTADKEPIVIPTHKDDYGNTIPAKTVMRKKDKKIIKSGNVHDGDN